MEAEVAGEQNKTTQPPKQLLFYYKTMTRQDPILFVHGTNEKNLMSILKMGYIDPESKNKNRFMLNASNPESHRVFLQILNVAPKNCPANNAHFWGQGVVMVFTQDVLDNQNGTYGSIGSFDNPTLSKRFENNGKWLGKFMKSIHCASGWTRGRNCGVNFMHSHEVTLENRIDLSTLVGVIVPHKIENKVRSLLDKNNITRCVVSTERTSYDKIKSLFYQSGNQLES